MKPPRQREMTRYGTAIAMLAVALVLADLLLAPGSASESLPVASNAPQQSAASGDGRKGPIVTERIAHCALERFASGVQAKFCATSVLGPQRDAAGRADTYGPEHLFDGNPATAWCEGVPGPGNGQQIEIAFSRPQVVAAITFVNGYAKSPATFARNNSVRRLSAIWPDGTASSIAMPDQRAPFVFTPAHKRAVNGLILRIEAVNANKWPDTCLTEVRLSLAAP